MYSARQYIPSRAYLTRIRLTKAHVEFEQFACQEAGNVGKLTDTNFVFGGNPLMLADQSLFFSHAAASSLIRFLTAASDRSRPFL